MLGLKRFDNAVVTISGIELAEKIKKNQFKFGKLGASLRPAGARHCLVGAGFTGPAAPNINNARSRFSCWTVAAYRTDQLCCKWIKVGCRGSTEPETWLSCPVF
jgi:hypothetical protein